MKYCSNCGNLLSDIDKFCDSCGRNVDAGNSQPITNLVDEKGSIIDSLNEYVGNTNSVNLNWKDLFTDVFKSHSVDEAEDIFICGTKKTTPLLSEVSATWPRPWLYSRVFFIFVLTFILLRVCWDFFNNTNVIPGMIAVGAFTVPLTTLIFFLEVNAFRNISVYYIVKTLLVGGCASLVATLFLFSIIGFGEMDFAGACMIGIIEEVGKVIIVYFFIKRLLSCNFILNGLLIGASVGAGFAAFESSGYAFNILVNGYGLDMMMDNIYLRGFLAPGGHITWAAISGAAIMIAKGNKALTFEVFLNKRFWRIFFIPVVLHAVWDMPLNIGSDIYLIPCVLTLAVWVVVLILINMGLDEVKQYNTVEE
ncbi:PrsW family glutamic-type intramembrane protease [Bacteroides thetaiotaomicron]|uniref:PrsW family glutamic-type intramembrane protease n=1 Tax=Bacteroides thetaiotaomicron TaxID=818 RepID=UPI001899554A|nr:PrsW family glutamic-type intramembrane protease [Bacteroides thetaiotaomicron]